MNDRLNTILTGTFGIGIVQMIGQVPINEVLQLLTQLIIGGVALWKLIKKPKPKANESEDKGL